MLNSISSLTWWKYSQDSDEEPSNPTHNVPSGENADYSSNDDEGGENNVILPETESLNFQDIPLSDDFTDVVIQNSPEDKVVEEFVMIDHTEKVDIIPDHVIPLTQKKETCRILIQKWLGEESFLPSDFESNHTISPQVEAAFVPFYVFSATSKCSYDCEVYDSISKSWNSEEGTHENTVPEVLLCGSFEVDRELLGRLMDKNHSFSYSSHRVLPQEMMQPFEFSTVGNYRIYQPQLTAKEAEGEARAIIEEKCTHSCKQHILTEFNVPESYVRNQEVYVSITELSQCLVLVPVLFCSFSYDQQKFDVLISGNKGVVEGNRPAGIGASFGVIRSTIESIGKTVNQTL